MLRPHPHQRAIRMMKPRVIYTIYLIYIYLICFILVALLAAELAAKKSRLKQKLVKSARSVAIFSLKLKERRQREAEKAATIAVEHAKVDFKIYKIKSK